MREWQYKVVRLEDWLMPALREERTGVGEGTLNDLGADGWELVDAVVAASAGGSPAGRTEALIFKRPA